ncbi:FABP family protein, partial [Streptomyces sp. SID7499]|nr:FABP family protein [Streptomyces sp. SID7499]
GPYSGGKRLYGYVKSDLMWVGEKATPEVELRPYMSAHLKKVVTPEEVAEMARNLEDMPDDGIAFFK